ncbi:MAG: hypothetical protein GC168_16855 [Candidatus Hydrogenedens sp.]|nr:hypothetical protein [Candidatus Hydrogenedens sp.]
MNSRLDAHILAWLDGELDPNAQRDLLEEAFNDPETEARLHAWREDLAAFDAALAPPEARYTFATLRARLETITPLDEIRLFLPRLRLDSPVPRFAVAAMLAAALGSSWLLGRFQRAQADAADRLRDRSDFVDDIVAMSADPSAPWPEDTDQA